MYRKTRRISKYTCVIELEETKGTVLIIDDWYSNYGVVYPFSVGEYDYLHKRNKQLVGMESPILNKKILTFFEYHINKYYSN